MTSHVAPRPAAPAALDGALTATEDTTEKEQDVALDPWRPPAAPPRLEPGPRNIDGVRRWRLVHGRYAPPAPAASPAYVAHVLLLVLAIAVLGQRFVLPLGATPIGVPLVAAYAGVLLLRVRGGLRYNRVRTELFLLAAGALLIVTWANTFEGSGWSLNSLLLLLVLYLPWVFCISPQYADQMRVLLRGFVRLMVAAAATALAQMTTQLAGVWAYEDYIDTFVPPDWLAQGYNTSFPMTYNSPIYKANAFLFLEPSFLCQFLALGILVGLLIKAPAWQLLLLGLGMACTLSGTGILLLIAGLVLLLLRYRQAIRPSYVIAGALALLVIFQTPAAPFLLDRRDETTQQGSSGYLRFVQPYTEVIAGLDAEPERYVIGAGPGSADRLLESGLGGKGEAVVYTIAPKIVFEYGLVAGTVFVAFLLVSVLRGPPLRVLPGAMIVMIFFLSGSLLQPHTIITAWVLTSIWGRPVTLGMTDALAAWRRQHGHP
jgi:hypothetical protein